MSFVHMRIAMPVASLEVASRMYIRGLSLKKIADFTDHDGYRVVIQNRGWSRVAAE